MVSACVRIRRSRVSLDDIGIDEVLKDFIMEPVPRMSHSGDISG